MKSNESILLEGDDIEVDLNPGEEVTDMGNDENDEEDDDFFPTDGLDLDGFDPDYEEIDVRQLKLFL